MKLLIIAPRFPYPIEKGDKLRLYHQIRKLSKRYKIYLVALTDIEVEQDHYDHVAKYVEEIRIFRLYKPWILWSLIFRFLSGKPLQVLYFYNRNIKIKIKKYHDQIKPDFVFNQLVRTAEYSKDLPGIKIIDYQDAFSTLIANRAKNSRWPFNWVFGMESRRLTRYESQVYPFFNKHLIISEQDESRLKKHVGGKIHVIPNGVDTDFFKSDRKQPVYELCFIGNMGYNPNVIASEYLVREIMPELVKKYPEIKLVLAGSRPDIRVRKLVGKNVFVTGWLEDIRQAYNESVIFVAPIFTGTGQQNKILEAMSMGMPCVCTKSVNHPIGGREGEDILVAERPEEFINHIDELLNNKEKVNSIGHSARTFVKQHYSWDQQVNKLIKLIEN